MLSLRNLAVVLGFLCVAAIPGRLFAAEQARSADGFVDAIGINSHFKVNYAGILIYTNPQIATLLGQSGLRHLRDDMPIGSTQIFRYVNLYTNYGIRVAWTPYIPGRTPPTTNDVVNYFLTNQFLEALDGPNEPDLAAVGSYIYFPVGGIYVTDNPPAHVYSGCQAYMNAMYQAIKANPATSNILVFAPGIGYSVEAKYLNPIASDYLAMHSYPNPPSGDPTNGLDMAFSNTLLEANTPMPIVTTETGYNTATNYTGGAHWVSEQAQAKYIPRLLLEHFNRNVWRTYDFEFANLGTNMTDKEQNWGLVRYDTTPKPAYTNIQNLISLLKEGVWDITNHVWNIPGFVPGSLDYSLSGTTNNVHHTLLQKSTGDFYLLLWQETPGFYNGGGSNNMMNWSNIYNPPVAVSLSLHTTITNAATYQLGSLTPLATYTNPTVMNLSVLDEVLVVKLIPSPYQAAPQALFNGAPISGGIPLTVSFADTSTGIITNRHWDFGDGAMTNTTAVNVTHTYSNAGNFTVALKVSGASGTNMLVKTNYIVAADIPFLARWTFNNPTNPLVSDNGLFTLLQSGTGSNITLDTNMDGSVSLGSGQVLFCTNINSATYPQLRTNVTIWARMRYDATPSQYVYTFGLSALTNAAASSQIAFAEEHAIAPGELATGRVADGTAFGAGSGFPPTPAAGTYGNYAIVFQQTDATHYNFQLNLDGMNLTRSISSAPSANLTNFVCLAMGRLYLNGASALTFDEIRIYTNSLTPEQIAGIAAVPLTSFTNPVANPDSATTAWNVPVTMSPLANDTDPNSLPLTVVSVSPTNGTASIVNGTNVLIIPTLGTVGVVTAGYWITNGGGGSASSLLTVTTTTPPKPVVAGVSYADGAMILGGTNGAPNGVYVVLASTNVALPVTSWTSVLTNTFNGSGAFNMTNAVDPAVTENYFLIKQ